MNALAYAPSADPTAEALTITEWSKVLGLSDRAVRDQTRGVGIKQWTGTMEKRFVTLHELPADYQRRALDARHKEGVLTFRDLLDVIHCETRKAGDIERPFASYPPRAQARAYLRMQVMEVYFTAVNAGRPEGVCNQLARQKWEDLFKNAEEVSDRTCTYKKIQRLRDRVRGMGGEHAPKEAYLDSKSCKHPNARREPSEDFLKDFKARMCNSATGVPSVNGVYSDYCAAWNAGKEVPGIGCRVNEEEPFPFTLNQIERHAPSRAVRELSGRGKFLAKVGGYLAAPPLDWTLVEPNKITMFDDKVFNFEIQSDDGMQVFTPMIYLAYCAGTGRILNFIVREAGRMTQLDVEGLQAAVARDHGFHHGIGGPSLWIFERGTVSISPARCEFLERMLRGYLHARTTGMLGGKSAPGDWSQAGKGNFFGKGRLEAMMGALDWHFHTVPGQVGNFYGVKPALVGDTTLTLQKMINSTRQGNKPARSLIEESLLAGAMSRILEWLENGENVSAYEATRRQGIKPPLLYYSDFVTLLAELFRRFNNRRGHRMQGFEKVRVPHPDGKVFTADSGTESRHTCLVSESPNDKAERMLGTMALQGRRLARPDDADIFLLLHKVRRVTVRANGCVMDGVTYSLPGSRAQRDAVAIMGAAKPFLALYNPVAPDALYLLANPPGHLNASATEIPKGFIPQLYEVLPRAGAADPTDGEAMRNRRENVAAFNARLGRAAALTMEPMLMAVHSGPGGRQELKDRTEPLRATILGSQASVAPDTMPASALSAQIADAESMINGASTRSDQRDQARPEYLKALGSESEWAAAQEDET